MQPTTRIRNKSTTWSALLRPRVGDVVVDSGVYYANMTGYNSDLSDTIVWLPFNSGGGASVEPIEKTAADIEGTDPGFYIDLTSEGVPDYPASVTAYVKYGTDPYQMLSPLQYYPETKRLYGFSDPAGFPDQNIKIFVI